jgi:hypothetical protein
VWRVSKTSVSITVELRASITEEHQMQRIVTVANVRAPRASALDGWGDVSRIKFDEDSVQRQPDGECQAKHQHAACANRKGGTASNADGSGEQPSVRVGRQRVAFPIHLSTVPPRRSTGTAAAGATVAELIQLELHLPYTSAITTTCCIIVAATAARRLQQGRGNGVLRASHPTACTPRASSSGIPSTFRNRAALREFVAHET